MRSELDDLNGVIVRTDADLGAALARQAEMQSHQGELAQRLNEERAAQLAPFVAALEQLSAEIARLEHKLTAFPAIQSTLERRDEADHALVTAQTAVDELGVLTTWLMYRNSAAFAGLEGGFPVEWSSIIGLAAATFAASLLATVGPARRAAAIRPARAVRVAE
ncbi:hypothetical protein ACF09L_33760 [Streptomyces sp. NPDC014779]|uniref:hypothetical protein n=1 Tax=Streptomyces sp. NPDC014779 TaxID=3364911 RepID=UPI0036F98472